MKIPFDIKYRPQIESGEYKVVTRDGMLARIICWDCKDDYYPILGLIDYSDREVCESFTIYGKNDDDIEVGNCDLFIITPEPEFDELLFECIKESWLIPKTGNNADIVAKHLVETWRDQLLAAANAELNNQIEQAYKNSDVVQYQRGYDKGCDDTNTKWREWYNQKQEEDERN